MRLRLSHVLVTPVLLWDDGENLSPGPDVAPVAATLESLPELAKRLPGRDRASPGRGRQGRNIMIYAFAVLLVALLWHVRTTNRLTTAHIDRLTEAQAQHTRHLQRVIAQKNPDLEQLIALWTGRCSASRPPPRPSSITP
jgi:hypothetical protein